MLSLSSTVSKREWRSTETSGHATSRQDSMMCRMGESFATMTLADRDFSACMHMFAHVASHNAPD
jgi:hypothetical protein